MNDLEYSILKECACGPEELHVLLSLIDFDDQEQLRCMATALSVLVREARVEAHWGSARRAAIDANEIVALVSDRRARGESLEDYPVDGRDFAFYATELGLSALSEEDRPVKK